jgi:YD repeat-containing protein
MKHRVKAAAVLLLLAALSSRAGVTTPNLARGFEAEKAYAFDEVGVVNLFNGNLNVSIPIGITYPVSSALSYSLTLQYGGNNWKYQTSVSLIPDENGQYDCYPEGNTTKCREETYGWSYPTDRDNAGFGWRLHLGRMVSPAAVAGTWAYESPDGAAHEFYATLHNGENATANVWYTRDGSYLRLRQTGGTLELESPDGLIRTFHTDPALPSKQRVERIRDRAGNSVWIDYDAAASAPAPTTFSGASETWHIYDSAQRHHYVYLRPATSYTEEFINASVLHHVVAEVRMQMPSGPAVWKFSYGSEAEGPPWETIPCPCFDEATVVPYGSGDVQVPLLKRVIPPEGNPFIFTYDETGTGIESVCSESSGILETVTLPTLGKVEWKYKLHHYPSSSVAPITAKHRRNMAKSVSVMERSVYAADGTLRAKRAYQEVTDPLLPDTDPLEKNVTVTDYSEGGAILRKSRSFFSLCADHCPTGVGRGEYSLPFTRKAQSSGPAGTDADGRSLSTIVYGFNGQWTTPIQWTYVGYLADVSLVTSPQGEFDLNRRMFRQRTMHATSGNPEWVDSTSSLFDGLGHYRKTIFTSSFDATTRTTMKNYNPSSGAFGSGVVTIPAPSTPWLLELFDSAEVTETTGGQTTTTVHTDHCFDTTTGFEKRRRTFRGPAVGPNDFLTIFEDDGTGEVLREKYYGGDATPLPVLGFATCTDALPNPSYTILHSYDRGVRRTSQFAGTSFKTLDVDVDASGLPMVSRDAAGIATTYTYDLLGRLTEIHPADSAWSHYAYTPASGTTGRASVEARQFTKGTTVSGQPLTDVHYYYDFLGRFVQQRQWMAGAAKDPLLPWAATAMSYDALGRKTATSVTVGRSTGAYSDIAAPVTSSTFDTLGRVVRVTPPDGKWTDVLYSGASSVTRTVNIDPAAATSVSTTELLDAQGRLLTVFENANNADGEPTFRTDYQYDAGGRLRKVLAGEQVRLFTYDGAGMLKSERHPESGTTGADNISYQYDARGNVTSKVTAAKTLAMTYDAAGRLKSVLSGGSPLQEFAYGPADAHGRMSSAVRHNWHPDLGGDVAVTETYTYEGLDGRMSSKQTTVSTGQTFVDHYTYHPFGSLAAVTYPQCTGCGGATGPARDVNNVYAAGFLTGVAQYTASSGIKYYPNGLLASLPHANGVLFEQMADADGMARPAETRLAATTCTPPDATITAPATLTAGAEGTASVSSQGSYSWTIQNGTITSSATAQSVTFRSGCSGSATLSVTVTSSCSASGSRSVIVTVPSVTVSASPAQITAGGTSTLTVTTTGMVPWTVVWSDGSTQTGNGSSIPRSVSPSATQTYSITSVNGCSGSWASATVTVNAPPPAPASLTATRNGGTITLLWTMPAGATADSYDVYRCSTNCVAAANFAPVGSSTSLTMTDVYPLANKAYVYEVRAIRSGVSSPPSPHTFQNTVSYTDAVTTGTPLRAVHLTEVRTAVSALRAAAGLAPISYTDSSVVLAAQFNELRTGANAARAQLGFAQVQFTDALVQGQTPARAVHLNEIRTAGGGV